MSSAVIEQGQLSVAIYRVALFRNISRDVFYDLQDSVELQHSTIPHPISDRFPIDT